MFAECLAVGLACGDQRRLTGSGSVLEPRGASWRCAIQIDVLYFFKKLTYCLDIASVRIRSMIAVDRLNLTLTVAVYIRIWSVHCRLPVVFRSHECVKIVIMQKDYSRDYVCYIYRCGGTRNAQILSVWRHCEHGFTHGINWRRLYQFYSVSQKPDSCD